MQEVGFPTRNEVEGGRRPVCTSAARKIGVLLARARDGVPQEGLVTLLCAERRKMLCSSDGRCGREKTAEEPGQIAGNGTGTLRRFGGLSAKRWKESNKYREVVCAACLRLL